MKNNVSLFFKGLKLSIEASSAYSILIFLFSAISGLVAPANAIIYQELIDSITKIVEGNTWLYSVLTSLVALSIVNLVNYALNGVLQFTKQTLCDKLDLNITNRVLKMANILPMEKFDNSKIYDHINTAINCTSTSCLDLLDSISEIIYSAIKSISFLIIILNFNVEIILICLLSVLPVLRLSLTTNAYWFSVFSKRVEKKRLIDYLKMIMIKNENIKEVKLYGVGDQIISQIDNIHTNFTKEDSRARKKILRKRFDLQCIDEVVTMGVKIWLLILAISQRCSLGSIILYLNSQDNLKFSLNDLINEVSSLHNSLLYLKSIDIIENENVNREYGKEEFKGQFQQIEFRNVSFKYPGKADYALKNISLKFERGKTYFIVGFNGSGKTTLIKLLLKLYEPTEGQILIDGKNLQEFSTNEFYAHVSAIFQDFIKYPFSVFDNVAIRSKQKAQFNTSVDIVGIRDVIEKLPDKEDTFLLKEWSGGTDLSQGQWQKLAISRCIYDESDISIFDEPFSSIDAEAESHIVSNLRNKSENKLMIFVTHRFSSISIADQIIVMKEGNIVEEGTHESLMENKSIYFELYTSQNRAQ